MNALAQVSLEPQPVMQIAAIDQTAIRLADEGIPVRAIARSLKTPSEDIYEILKEAILTGALIELPKDDWPPGSRRSKRSVFNGDPLDNEETFQFACARAFKITRLESAILSLLLKRAQATREQLHHAIKQPRPGQNREETEPKIVDVVICHMRKKLKPHDIKIETVWGIGYLITATDRERAITILTEATMEIAGG